MSEMDEKTEQTTNSTERKFDFYEIEWVIEKFYLITSAGSWLFDSPEFTVRGFNNTTWLLSLICVGSDFFEMSLKRSDSDAGPDIMWVDWRMNVSCPDWEYDSIHKLCPFIKGYCCSENMGSLNRVLETFKPFESDLFTFRCKMLFFSEEAGKGFQPCNNPELRSLSENLLQLFRTSREYDLEMTFGEKVIPAHKVIVCSRIKELNYLIEQEGRRAEDNLGKYDVLDLSSLNYDGMMKVMEYTYSGDLKYVLGAPSLAVHDCVMKFNIPELKSYYTPNKLFFKTGCGSGEFNFTWIIPDIRELMNDEFASSPTFIDDDLGTSWRLHLSSSNKSNVDYFDLHAEAIEVNDEKFVCLECAIADKNDRYFFVKRCRCLTEGLGRFGFKGFIGRNVVKSFSDDNCLKVVARLNLSDRLINTYIDKHHVSFITCTPPERCYYLLSVNMKSAYDAGFFSDLRLEVNSVTYKIHKSILHARSSKIYDIMLRMKPGDENPFSKLSSNVFCMLLKYLYTGSVMESEYEKDFIELYDSAVFFDLPLLKKLCSTHLKILVQNNVDIRAKVLEISEKYQDEDLMNSVRKYISEL